MGGNGGTSGGRKKRIRIRGPVPWVTDRDGQRVEAWRLPKGVCDYCSRIAYREETVEGKTALVCERHRARVLRTSQPSNTIRTLRDVDIEIGRRAIEREPEITSRELRERVNAFRERSGLNPVGLSTVYRWIYAGRTYRSFEE